MPELRIAGSRLYHDAACHFQERIFRNTASELWRFLAFDEYLERLLLWLVNLVCPFLAVSSKDIVPTPMD
jgi:hypothetical protein